MRKFIQGMMYCFRGFSHLSTKGLKRFIVLPIVFNFALFIGMFYWLYHYSTPYAHRMLNLLPSWLHFLSWIFLILFFISCFLLFLSLFTIIFNLLAAPFNGLLAEKAQKLLYNSTIPSISFSNLAWRSIKRQGQFLLYVIPRFVGLLLLFFVPFLHPIYPIVWFLFNAWILSVQYQDFAADNNLMSFSSMRTHLQENAQISLGFGTFINLASAIPIINLFIMPSAVIGGVIMYCEHQNPKLLTLK